MAAASVALKPRKVKQNNRSESNLISKSRKVKLIAHRLEEKSTISSSRRQESLWQANNFNVLLIFPYNPKANYFSLPFYFLSKSISMVNYC
ncbi:MAG: hypothetical protein MHMPM18_003672 [Marteilia pararefringens]